MLVDIFVCITHINSGDRVALALHPSSGQRINHRRIAIFFLLKVSTKLTVAAACRKGVLLAFFLKIFFFLKFNCVYIVCVPPCICISCDIFRHQLLFGCSSVISCHSNVLYIGLPADTTPLHFHSMKMSFIWSSKRERNRQPNKKNTQANAN